MLPVAFVVVALLEGGFSGLVGVGGGDRLIALLVFLAGAGLLGVIVLHLRRPVIHRPPRSRLRFDVRSLVTAVRRRRRARHAGDDDARDG